MRKLVFLLFLAPLAAFSQRVENTKAEAVGEKIIITYDLTGGEPGDQYTISIFASHDNFGSPLAKVIGDVGANVKEGKGKRIEWESKSELGKYKGALSFEIEVKVVAPLTLKTELTSAKRGKALPLRWRGGDQNQNIKIELLKGGVVESTVGTLTNNGGFEWSVPATDKDNLLIFYAGHGYLDKQRELGYWLPSDAKRDSRSNWISNSDIKDNLAMASIRSKHTLLITDACFGGSIFKSRSIGADQIMQISEMYKEPSRRAMTSGNLSEVPDKSIFLQQLLKKLGDNEDEYLPALTLYTRIYEPITNNSATHPVYGIIQGAGDEGGDFIFEKRKK